MTKASGFENVDRAALRAVQDRLRGVARLLNANNAMAAQIAKNDATAASELADVSNLISGRDPTAH